MYRQDIKGSMAHAAMLSATGIIGAEEADTLIAGLEGILKDLERGTLSFDPACEDIHMFVEEVLTARVGDPASRSVAPSVLPAHIFAMIQNPFLIISARFSPSSSHKPWWKVRTG